MSLAAEVLIVRPSALVLVTLLMILGASVWIFAALVRRETKHRKTVALALWARSRNLRVAALGIDLPELAPFKQFKPQVHSVVRGENLTLVQIETVETALIAGIVAAKRWNLIFHKLSDTWRTTALRPTAHAVSAADLFSLSSYPSLMPTQRFVIFGSESRSAQALAQSSAPALLPADVGLILYGNYLILDFSGRQFDEIEFDRLIDLTEQLAPKLLCPKIIPR
jgi:hypothetical protein